MTFRESGTSAEIKASPLVDALLVVLILFLGASHGSKGLQTSHGSLGDHHGTASLARR